MVQMMSMVISKCGPTHRRSMSTAISSLKVCTATAEAKKSNKLILEREVTVYQRLNSHYTASKNPRVRHVPHSYFNRESFSTSKVHLTCTQLRTILILFSSRRRLVMQKHNK